MSYQRIVIFFLIACLWLNGSVAFALDSSGKILSPTCENLEGYQLKSELQNIVDDYFTAQRFPVSEIVEKHWKILDIDSEIDIAIGDAVTQIRNKENLWNKFSSNWSKDQAKSFVETIVNKAVSSEKLERDFNDLSLRISNEISRELELKVSQSSQEGVRCLQQYIGSKYSEVFQGNFTQKIDSLDPDKLNEIIDPTLNPVISNELAIGGIAVIVASQISKNIANQVAKRVLVELGERILGRIGAAIIPFIGEIVGGILIAVDVTKSLDGTLPEIEKELKKPELKNAIENEFIDSVQDVIGDKFPEISGSIANELYHQWQSFQYRYQKALDFAEKSPEFKKILEKNKSSEKLDKVFSLITNCTYMMGENKIIESINNGKFEEALRLPQSSFVILQNHDLDYLLDYANLAGKQLDKVVEFEIYKHISPDKLSGQILDNILSINDSSTIAKLALLNVTSIQELLNISTDNLIQISARLTPDNLNDLAQSLANLKQDDINGIISLLLSDDKLMSNLKYLPDLVKSPNIQDAIAFWKKQNSILTYISGFWGMLTFNLGWHFVADKLNMAFTFLAILFISSIFFILSLIAFLLWILLKSFNVIPFIMEIISKNFNTST
jgi:hypothetical protein